MEVAERDLRALSSAIYDLRSTLPTERFPGVALEVTTKLVRNDLIAWNEVDPVAQHFVVRFHPDEPYFPHLQDRFNELSGEHPVIHHIITTGDGSARKISDFVTSEELHEQRLYREVYAEMGVEHQISVTVPSVQPRIVAVAANRNDLGDDFDERDRMFLNLLRPHLAQSYELSRDRERIHGVLNAASQGLRAEGAHMVVLDDPPHELTPGAMTVLYRAFGPPGLQDPLPRRVSAWLERERARAAASPEDELPALRRPLVSERHGRRTVARYVPSGPVDGLLLRDELLAPDATRLELLGLTPREAEVLQHVVSGDTNASIARSLHVEPSTVKTHLENIYRKLGVRGRVPAVAMALDLLAADIRRSAD